MSRREQRLQQQRVTRRRFLGLAVGGGVVGAAAAYGIVQLAGGDDTKQSAGSSTTASSTQPVSPTETIPAGADSAYARVGRAYLQQAPEESSTDALQQALPPEFTAGGAPNWGALGPQVGTDYTKGDIVTLDGWRMSRTEARAAAYVALTAG